jgi:dihydroflavonol-4-reductase
VPEPVFVTGASGFVGGAVLRHLVAAGREVRALARTDESAEILGRAGAVPIRGDVFDPEALLAGMRGCVTVFHVAGVNAMCMRDPGPMLHTNVEGSVQVLRAAAAAGVGRFVHTSSAATIGEPEGVVGTEVTPHRGWFLSQYERSKVLAEQRVLELGREQGLGVVCVNPSSVQGPGRTQGSARLLLELLRRRRPPIVESWLSIVDVDDCAAGHLLAERHGVAGERYLLNGASLTTSDAVALLRSVSGRPPHLLRLPRSTVSVAGTVAGLAMRIGGAPTLPRAFCPEVARTLLHGHRFDGSRAERDLGLRYRPLRETLERTLSWYRALDLVPDPARRRAS